MLKPRVLLAQARAPFIHAHIAAVQGLALRVSASPAIIRRFANLLASFDLAHRAKGPVSSGQWSAPKVCKSFGLL